MSFVVGFTCGTVTVGLLVKTIGGNSGIGSGCCVTVIGNKLGMGNDESVLFSANGLISAFGSTSDLVVGVSFFHSATVSTYAAGGNIVLKPYQPANKLHAATAATPLFFDGANTPLSQSGTADGVGADGDFTSPALDGCDDDFGVASAAFGVGFDSDGNGGAMPGGRTGIGSNFILFGSVVIRDSPRIVS